MIELIELLNRTSAYRVLFYGGLTVALVGILTLGIVDCVRIITTMFKPKK